MSQPVIQTKTSNLNKLVLNIDSSQRILGTTTDFTINPNLSTYGASEIKSVQLLSVELPNSFYSVSTLSNNFKLRIISNSHPTISSSNYIAPPSYLIDINLDLQNYDQNTIVSSLQSKVNAYIASMGWASILTSQPILFNLNTYNYKLTISLASSLQTNYSFILPYSSCSAKILGFSGLSPDTPNINSSNNTIATAFYTNNIGTSYNSWKNKIVVDSTNNKFQMLAIKSLGEYPETGSGGMWLDPAFIASGNSRYMFIYSIPNGSYTVSELCNQINTGITNQISNMFQTTSGFNNTYNWYQAWGSTKAPTITFSDNKFKLQSPDSDVSFYLIGDNNTTHILKTIGLFGAQSNFFYHLISSPTGNYLKNVITSQIPVGYWTTNALNVSIPTIVNKIFNGLVNYTYNGNNLILLSQQPTQTSEYYPDRIGFQDTSTGLGVLGINSTRVVSSTALTQSWDTNLINNTFQADSSPNVTSLKNVYTSSVTSNTVINLRGLDYVLLQSSAPQAPSCDGYGTARRVLAKIPLSAPTGFTVFWTAYSEELYRYPCSLNDLISFTLTDKDNNILDNQGLDWSLTLVLYYDS